MAKQPTPAPAAVASTFDESTTLAPLNELALLQADADERVTTLAAKLNYQGSTDMASLENSARDAIRRIGMAVFELGAYLLLLKEGCDHGQFIEVLGRLDINRHSVQRYMAITQRFANAATSPHLEKLGFSKMAELLPLDNDQTDGLLEDGQTGELALDDVARMSVRELRAAVRKERGETTKQKGAVERLTAVNTELHEEARLVKRLKPDEALTKIKTEATVAVDESLGMVRGRLRQALLALNDAADHPSKTTFMAGLVAQVQAEVAALRDEFNLPDMADDGVPEWQRWAEANPVDAQATQ